MKKIMFVIILSIAISCNKKTTTITQSETDLISLKYVSVKVVLQTELAGCGYMLALDDGKMLAPLNLSDTLKHDGLKIYVKYHPEKNAMGVCMMGTMVSIDDVKPRRK